jgi:Tol biopolymer transport system component
VWLASGPHDGEYLAWSPDGRTIAFVGVLGEARARSIYVIPALGGAERQVAEVRFGGVRPLSGSPDGRFLAAAELNYAQGGQGLQLTHNGGWVAFESHDGQSLYYTRGSDSVPGQELWVLPLSGRKIRSARAMSQISNGSM